MSLPDVAELFTMHRDDFNISPNGDFTKEAQSYSDNAVANTSRAETEALWKTQKLFPYSATRKKERKEKLHCWISSFNIVAPNLETS